MRYAIVSLGLAGLTGLALPLMPGASPVLTQRRVDTAPLRTVRGLEKDDLARLAEGRTVARTLDGADDREVAAIGAVSLSVPRDTFVDALRDLVSFKRGTAVPQIGRFSATPAVADLGGLTIDPTDLRDLRECRADRCKIHLPRETVEKLQREVSATRAIGDEQLSTLFKAFLVQRVSNYLAGGRSALQPYAQRSDVKAPAADLEGLLTASSPYARLSPAVFDYLRTFPAAAATETQGEPTPDVEQALYWAKEHFGWKPVITLTHWVVGPKTTAPGQPVVGASLQLYASHYIDVSLGLTLVFEPVDPDAARRSCLVVYINRSRAKATTSMFGMTRRLIESRTRDGLRRHLDALKTRFVARAATP